MSDAIIISESAAVVCEPVPTARTAGAVAVAGALFDCESVFKRYIDYIDAAPTTIESYKRCTRQFFIYSAEHGLTGYPTRADVVAYRDYLREKHCAGTVRLYMLSLRRFLGWCVAEGLADKNPAADVKGGKVSREHKKDCLTEGQVARVLKSAKGDGERLQQLRDHAILWLMFTAGVRTIEVSRANVGDLGTASGEPVLYVQGKGRQDKAEYVKISQTTDDAIRDYLAARGTVAETEPLFGSLAHNHNGGRMTTRAISGLAKTAMVNVGLNSKRLTAHSARHTAVTLWLKHGKSLQEAQQAARHKNIDTTTIYAHALERVNNDCELVAERAILAKM